MFFQTYPNDASLDIDNSPLYYMVSIEYYDDNNDIQYDYIECDDLMCAVCLCDKLDDGYGDMSFNYEPIWNSTPIDMNQSPSHWSDY